jgi:hypothetical protein
MNQSQALYDTSAALALIDPCLRAHLPTLDAAVTRRFIQLVTGIFEERSLVLEAIAESSTFSGTDSNNVTQVRRIIRGASLTWYDRSDTFAVSGSDKLVASKKTVNAIFCTRLGKESFK